MITLGIDLGTSGLKAALVGDDDRVLAQASAPLTVQRNAPGHSEQDPRQWWQACGSVFDQLSVQQSEAWRDVAAIGLSGHMHGATLVDAAGELLRPCILWNDGRSAAQCAEFEARWPESRQVTGNQAMPGFTAPKLLWVQQHEPAIFARIHKVLLPKAWLRWQLCGEAIEDLSDASGTLWLDVAGRDWSDAALAATDLTRAQMPALVEGTAACARLSPALTRQWGFSRAPVIAGGAGDNAAGAVSLGAVNPGDAFVSLGTSGVLWATTERFSPNPAGAVHAFCHAVPGVWHQMGVVLAAASCLAWWAGVTGLAEASLLAEIDDANADPGCWFAPYLSGERTPHNDAMVRGGFVGLSADASRPQMTLAVLSGVAYAMRDAQQSLAAAGTELHEADMIGGGARSQLWGQLMADVLGLPLHRVVESEIGCALGAARLARAAAGDDQAPARKPRRLHTHEPRPEASAWHAARHLRWQQLYPSLRKLAR